MVSMEEQHYMSLAPASDNIHEKRKAPVKV